MQEIIKIDLKKEFLVIKCKALLHPDYLERLQKEFTEQAKKGVLVLPANFTCEIIPKEKAIVECCNNCRNLYTEYGFDLCKKHDFPREDPNNDKCEDYEMDYDLMEELKNEKENDN